MQTQRRGKKMAEKILMCSNKMKLLERKKRERERDGKNIMVFV